MIILLQPSARNKDYCVFKNIFLHERGIQLTSVLESRAGRGLHPGSVLLPEAWASVNLTSREPQRPPWRFFCRGNTKEVRHHQTKTSRIGVLFYWHVPCNCLVVSICSTTFRCFPFLSACLYNDKTYSHGDMWHPVLGRLLECILCTCTDGLQECKRITCPSQYPCQHPLKSAGKCCKTCPGSQT